VKELRKWLRKKARGRKSKGKEVSIPQELSKILALHLLVRMAETRLRIKVSKSKIAEFCRKNHIKKLAFFGSVLRRDFSPQSDVDVLVEFEQEHIPGFFSLVGMEQELSRLFGGREVDLRTPNDLSRYFRDEVTAKAEVLYIAA